ncbi:MAG: DEAD/DEAH box helicase [Clostridia bacterium]|nr:DEAD/DEAH box helicase [Clostridia bacterium]
MAKGPSFLRNWFEIRKYKRLLKRIEKLSGPDGAAAKKARKLERKIVSEQIDRVLSNTPAEELKKYRTGAILTPLAKYSVKDVYSMSVKKLVGIKGVGPKSAYLIKNCAIAYYKEVQQAERLRVSPDDRSSDVSALVKSVYRADKLGELSAEARSLKEAAAADKGLAKKARAAANPLRWLFTKDKASALESMSEIERILASGLPTELDYIGRKRSDILKARHDEYWRSFCDDPARFYSVLENAKAAGNGGKAAAADYSYLAALSPQLKSEIDRVEVSTDGLRCVLRPYQLIGVKYILHQGNVLLGDEMGLGKTIEAIGTMVSLRNGGQTHFVVVCPASVLINWEREIQKHSDLSCRVLHGADFDSNLAEWENNGGVAILNYESAGRFVSERPIALTVVDEAHYIKNCETQRTRSTAEILSRSQRRLFMTGTPLENRLEEMVALINMLQPERVREISRLPRPIDRDRFRQVVAPVYFRRTKDAVWKEMPALQIVEDVVELTPAERALYIDCVRERTMAAFARMRQISFAVDSEQSSKLTRIKEICEEAFENGRKVLIFSFYLETIEKIRQALGGAVFGPITGSISPEKRQEIIDDFSAHEGGAVLLSQIIAGGTGLNIQKASIVIMCEPQYKPSTENQAIARAYRIGQTSNVTVYRLLCSKTVDERLLQVLKEKQRVFDAYADKSVSGENSLQIKESDIAAAEFDGTLVK